MLVYISSDGPSKWVLCTGRFYYLQPSVFLHVKKNYPVWITSDFCLDIFVTKSCFMKLFTFSVSDDSFSPEALEPGTCTHKIKYHRVHLQARYYFCELKNSYKQLYSRLTNSTNAEILVFSANCPGVLWLWGFRPQHGSLPLYSAQVGFHHATTYV